MLQQSTQTRRCGVIRQALEKSKKMTTATLIGRMVIQEMIGFKMMPISIQRHIGSWVLTRTMIYITTMIMVV